MKNKECEPSSETKLLDCFRELDDYDNTGVCKGYIEAGRMRELLSSKGKAPFREKEIDAFMKVAKDKETGHIYYEDYINLLMAFNANKAD